MRSTYDSSQRQRSRERTTRDGQYSIPRDVSPDDPYNRPYSTHQFAKKKRVKFNDQEDVRVFRKQDQPIAKSLSDDQIFLIKKQIQKEVSRIYDFNWDQKKHFDALSQQNSMKEQKEKEKQLYEKLMGMKEQIQFYTPYALALSSSSSGVPEAGSQSIEKNAHAQRTKDVLGCYYTQINQIPNEPIFEVATQCNKNQPKVILFHAGGINEGQQFVRTTKKNEKILKNILKMPGQITRVSIPKSQQRQITPRLLWLLKDMQVNKLKYNKQMTQLLLKPYKDSGQLQYWMKNQESLNEKLKNQPTGVPAPPSNIAVIPVTPPQEISLYQPMGARMSPSPSNQFKPQFSSYDPIQKTQKFKTVPCKYFHGPQGCVKTQNCTFIHDERYRGIPHPIMMRQQYQYPGGSNTLDSRGGFQQNLTFQRRDNFQNYGAGYQQGGNRGDNFNQNKNFAPKKYDNYSNPSGPYPSGGYNPQGTYPGYGQPGQMTQSTYPQMNQQMGQQQQPPISQGYSGYPNPQQSQMSMYYGQGQGGSMQPRGSTQR